MPYRSDTILAYGSSLKSLLVKPTENVLTGCDDCIAIIAHDERRVEAAREKRPERNVRHHANPDGVFDLRVQAFGQLGQRSGRRLVEAKLKVTLRFTDSARLANQPASGGELADTFKRGPRDGTYCSDKNASIASMSGRRSKRPDSASAPSSDANTKPLESA